MDLCLPLAMSCSDFLHLFFGDWEEKLPGGPFEPILFCIFWEFGGDTCAALEQASAISRLPGQGGLGMPCLKLS